MNRRKLKCLSVSGALAALAPLAPLLALSPAESSLAFRNGFEECVATPEKVVFAGAGADTLEAWLWKTSCAPPAGASAVVMLHGCSGVYFREGDQSADDISRRMVEWAERLNRAGVHALLVDSFSTRDHTEGSGHPRQDYCGQRASIEAIGAREEVERPLDALGAYDFLASLPGSYAGSAVDAGRVGLLGWSHGASAALVAVARASLPRQPFQAAVAYYPGCGLYGAFGDAASGASDYIADVPVAIHVGSDDTIAVAAQCAAHRDSSLAASPATFDLHVWMSARHSFEGAQCVPHAAGSLISPWSGLAYLCTGTYDGVPFDLHDWRAKINADRQALCLFADALQFAPGPTCSDDSIDP